MSTTLIATDLDTDSALLEGVLAKLTAISGECRRHW